MQSLFRVGPIISLSNKLKQQKMKFTINAVFMKCRNFLQRKQRAINEHFPLLGFPRWITKFASSLTSRRSIWNWANQIPSINDGGLNMVYLLFYACHNPGYEHVMYVHAPHWTHKKHFHINFIFWTIQMLGATSRIFLAMDIYQGWLSSLFTNMHSNDPKHIWMISFTQRADFPEAPGSVRWDMNKTWKGRDASECREVFMQLNLNSLGIVLVKNDVSCSLRTSKLYWNGLCQRMWAIYVFSVEPPNSSRTIYCSKPRSLNASQKSHRRTQNWSGMKNN